MTQRAGGRPRPGLVSGHRRNEVLIRATTQKNFESDVLNGKRPSARHALCKAPAEAPGAPAPGGERAPAAAGGGRSGWARVSFQGVENATALDSGEGCAPLQHTLESAGSHTLERRILRYANYISIKRM